MRYLKNTVKQKLKAGKRCVGSWINMPSPEVAEIMAKGGFEFLVIDMEHSAIDVRTMQTLIQVIEGHHVIPIVRVERNHPVPIKKALDAGAYGIIVPMVSTVSAAKEALSSIYYPPKGNRGVGLSRAQGYGQEFEKYQKWCKNNILAIVQIEHRDAISELEGIASLKGVDATMIGPYDLSGSYGYPGEYKRKEIQVALAQYEKISKRCQKPMGFHVVQPEASLFRDKVKKGYKFLPYSIDEILFGRKIKDELKQIKNISR